MLRNLSILLATILLIGFSSVDVKAQYRSKHKKVKHRFNAGLILGVNTSQIDGDLYSGFDKKGIRSGLKGAMYLNDQLDLVVGFLYNQKGSRFEDIPANNSYKLEKNRVIHLNYMEVPLLISIKTKKGKDYGCRLETGFSYARLINYKIEEAEVLDPEKYLSYNALAKDFNSNEFNFLASLNYFFNRHIGIGFTYTLQMNEVYHNTKLDFDSPPDYVVASFINKDPTLTVASFRNYQIAFQVIYNVF